MISVKQAVIRVVDNSEFVRKSLRDGFLNGAAYAKAIQPQVQLMLKNHEVSVSSITMALSRYGRELRSQAPVGNMPMVVNVTSRSKLARITYEKSVEAQERAAMLALLDSIKKAPFLIEKLTPNALSFVVDAALAPMLQEHFGQLRPVASTDDLGCVTIHITPRVGLSPVAKRTLDLLSEWSIFPVDMVYDDTQLHVIVNTHDAGRSYRLLHDVFLVKRSDDHVAPAK